MIRDLALMTDAVLFAGNADRFLWAVVVSDPGSPGGTKTIGIRASDVKALREQAAKMEELMTIRSAGKITTGPPSPPLIATGAASFPVEQ